MPDDEQALPASTLLRVVAVVTDHDHNVTQLGWTDVLVDPTGHRIGATRAVALHPATDRWRARSDGGRHPAFGSDAHPRFHTALQLTRLLAAPDNPAARADILVAHDASVVRLCLPASATQPPGGPGRMPPWISTYKIARQCWAGLADYTLDALVAARGLTEAVTTADTGTGAGPMMLAARHARATALLLDAMLRDTVTLAQALMMHRVMTQPLAPPPLPSDDAGWRRLPGDDLRWLVGRASRTSGPGDRAAAELARRVGAGESPDWPFTWPEVPSRIRDHDPLLH